MGSYAVCKAGFYGDGSSCNMCTGNTIKPTAGNGPNCDVTCDMMTTVPNELRTACGEFSFKFRYHYTCFRSILKKYNFRTRCYVQKRQVKWFSGILLTECKAGYYGNGSISCTLCPGNKIKLERGDALECLIECPTFNEPNDDHTECGLLLSFIFNTRNSFCMTEISKFPN